MKLGILVVYQCIDDLKQIFLVHSKSIAENTEGFYTLYAGGDKLSKTEEATLKSQRNVQYFRLKPFPTEKYGGVREHSHYLEQLIQLAIIDNCDSIATFHLDSFPIVKGWNVLMERLINKKSPLVIPVLKDIKGPYTAAMYFRSDFYKQYTPPFLLSDNTDEFRTFTKTNGIFKHSGSGFLWTLSRHNLKWKVLPPGKQKIFYAGDVHGGIVFHLRGGTRFKREIMKIQLHTNLKKLEIIALFLIRIIEVGI